mmetsp:Transcript_23671/g.29538  ORF Transcript_23671/g.29538 Transcript_23671/m.29538 type:complete len:568 (-) Transcript_23671:531-2234(-)
MDPQQENHQPNSRHPVQLTATSPVFSTAMDAAVAAATAAANATTTILPSSLSMTQESFQSVTTPSINQPMIMNTSSHQEHDDIPPPPPSHPPPPLVVGDNQPQTNDVSALLAESVPQQQQQQQKQQQQQQNVVFSQQSAREQISSSTMGSASGSTAVSRRAPAPAAHQEFAYHSIARSVMAPVPAQWMSAGPSDAFRYPTEPQHVTSYRAPQCYDQGNNSPSSGEAEREEATDKLGRLEDIGTQRSRLERHRSDGPYGNNLVAHPSHASLTSFDLPSFNSMDNLALLDSAGSIGFNSPWPSNMNLASQASSFNHNNDFALVNRQASENNLAQILEQQVSRGGDGGSGREAVYQFVSHQHNGPPPSSLQMVGNGAINDYNGIASRHHANQKQDHNGAMPSWPSFNALVAGMEDSQSLVAAQKLTQRADIKNQSIANTAATDEVDLPDPEQQGLRSRTASDRPLERGGPIVHRHSAPDFPATVNAEISRHAIKSSPKQQIRRQNRNSSVENFLSLVHSGDIPAPDANLLSSPILQQINGSSAGQTSGATRKRAVDQSLNKEHQVKISRT